MKTAIAALAVLALAAGATAFYAGLYDISATDQHLAPTYRLLDFAMQRSVKQRADDIAVPPLDDAAKIALGARHFRTHCVQCHGAPGVAPEPFAMGMTPAPANLVHGSRAWQPAELFWITREGIKMTGMPAWKYRLDDDGIWAVVAFIGVLPTLSPERYRAEFARAGGDDATAARASVPAREGDAGRGEFAINQYLCVTCHRIPGIVGPNAPVGPPLAGIGTRAFIAGVLPNTRETMIAWLRSPRSFRPQGAMPNLGVTEQDAADIAAYLATLR